MLYMYCLPVLVVLPVPSDSLVLEPWPARPGECSTMNSMRKLRLRTPADDENMRHTCCTCRPPLSYALTFIAPPLTLLPFAARRAGCPHQAHRLRRHPPAPARACRRRRGRGCAALRSGARWGAGSTPCARCESVRVRKCVRAPEGKGGWSVKLGCVFLRSMRASHSAAADPVRASMIDACCASIVPESAARMVR